MKHNVEDWLEQLELNPTPNDPPMTAPSVDPNQGEQGEQGDTTSPDAQNMQDLNNPTPNPKQEPQDSEEQQPESPDMPEKTEDESFEKIKTDFLKFSVKNDTNQLLETLNKIRDKSNLMPYQKKFIEDNFNIQLIKQNANVEKACNQIRKSIKLSLDKNNPSVSLVGYLSEALDNIPMLKNIFIKLEGYEGIKGDLHRKYLAALLGAVQVGSGANNEDLILNERDYSILISTRFNSQWGNIMLGEWSLRADDPETFLTEPETKRMTDGSPDERDVLRKRVIIESIAQQFKTRSFIIQSVSNEGEIQTLGLDLATMLRSSYMNGKLIVKTKISENSESAINEEGKIIPYIDIFINYVKETDEMDKNGFPIKKEFNFIQKKNGILFLTADSALLRKTVPSMQGMIWKAIPYDGNPSDLKNLKRCVYSSADLIMRQC